MNGPEPKQPLRVLSLTTLYPRSDDPLQGLFVRARLIRVAEHGQVKVLAPVALVEWGKPGRKVPQVAETLAARLDGALTVLHPRWFYVPGVAPLLPLELSLCLLSSIRQLRQTFDFDVIDAHFGHPTGAAAALLSRAFGKPFVVTLRGSEVVHAASPLVRKTMSWSLKSAARVIAVSRPLADFACSLGARPDHCSVIPNGIDSEIFHPRDRQACRVRTGMKEDRLHILSAGHLIEGKGHHRVVASLPHLHALNIPADVWIVGGAGRGRDFTPAIRAAIREHRLERYVHLLPPVPPNELAEFMCASDIFCLASSREGWPNVVSEASACGTPVVATRVGGVPEQLPDDRFGLIAAPDHQEALNEALAAALQRKWDRPAIAAWGSSRSWEQTASETLSVLRVAANKS